MPRRMMALTVLMSLLASLVLSFGKIPARELSTTDVFPDAKAVDAQMTALMSRFLIPGAGLALIKNGQIVYTKGYGYSNIDKKQLATDESEFAIGSITKSFTALAIMQLVEAGKVDLDAPVMRYLPDFKLAEESYTPLLKVRHLLSQSSGLPRADERWAGALPASRADVIADMAKIAPTAKPGEVWQYCNQNYAVLGAIIEKVSGMGYEAYLQKNIFDPLGMKSANLTIEELFKSENPALPHNLDILNGFALLPSSSTGFQAVKMLPAAGAINASVKDMATYALLQLGKGKQLVSAKSLETMHTKAIKLTGMPEGDQITKAWLSSDLGYGFGWMTETYRDKALVGHGGSIDGYEAQLTFVPSDDDAVVILTNTAGAATAFNEAVRFSMIELLLGMTPTKDIPDQLIKRLEVDVDAYTANVALAKAYRADAAELNKFVGDYAGIAGQFNISAKAGKLIYKATAPINIEVELIPFAAGKFLLNNALNSVFEFKADSDGVGVWQTGIEVGRRNDGKSSATIYTDPKARFTLPIAPGLTVEQQEELAVFKPKDGSYTLTVGTVELKTDQDTTVAALAASQTPSITDKPVDTRKIPVGALTWTQYIYQNADQSLFVVEALVQGKTLYFITIAGEEAAITKATPALNTMLIRFELKK